MSSRRRSGAIYAAVVVVIALTAFLIAHALWKDDKSSVAYEHCTVGAFDLDPDQAAVASTMVGVVTTRSLPERAAVLVLAAGLQESKLRNLGSGDGDRDSVGVLQQRPSQGWGTPAQLNNLHYATGAFLDALIKLPNWQTRDLADAIQSVQISADGTAYSQHETEAQTLADALMGRPPAAITCAFNQPTKVANVAKVAAAVKADLPVNTPTTTALTVSVPGAAWQTAAWFVANAYDLGVDKVAYNHKEWSRAKGWHTADAAGVSAVVATMATVKN